MTDDRNPRYVCEGCQSKENDAGETVDVDKVRETTTLEAARTLAKIHELKTGHSPKVRA